MILNEEKTELENEENDSFMLKIAVWMLVGIISLTPALTILKFLVYDKYVSKYIIQLKNIIF